VSKTPGLAFGRLVAAGSTFRTSPARSYVACTSVATDELTRASGSSTGSVKTRPRGGLSVAVRDRAAAPAACAASVAFSAEKSARASATAASSPTASPSASNRLPLTAPIPSPSGEATPACDACKGGIAGGSGANGRAEGRSAGSRPSWREGRLRLILGVTSGCLLSTCQRVARVDFKNPQTENAEGAKNGLMARGLSSLLAASTRAGVRVSLPRSPELAAAHPFQALTAPTGVRVDVSVVKPA